jgi:hypothetical protein
MIQLGFRAPLIDVVLGMLGIWEKQSQAVVNKGDQADERLKRRNA